MILLEPHFNNENFNGFLRKLYAIMNLFYLSILKSCDAVNGSDELEMIELINL